jgi:hypothetical protein
VFIVAESKEKPMADQSQFTQEEVVLLAGFAGVNDFINQFPPKTTLGEMRSEIRKRFLRPPTTAQKLRQIAELWGNSDHAPTIEHAADELDNLYKWTKRRPISELHQEPWSTERNGRAGGPNRWIVLWSPSGYGDTNWRCAVGRLQPDGCKFAQRFVDHSGELFTDGGEAATHFSELPVDE